MGTYAVVAPAAGIDRSARSDQSVAQAAPLEVDLESAVAVFIEHRPRLFKIAHRILGSASEAEDVVQEVWMRWQRTDRGAVINPPAFLATATTRIAINVIQAAHSRRETAVTPWLEGLAGSVLDGGDGPERTAERTEVVDLAIGVLLERLNPAERAAYVLRKGFDYPYHTIAAVLHVNVANARQLVSRAHRHLHYPRRQPVCIDTRRRLVRAFVTAARVGELDELEDLLAADVAGIAC